MTENDWTQFSLMTCKMHKQTVLHRGGFWTFVQRILTLKIRNPNNANPTPELLSIAKLLILTDVTCRLHANYVGIIFLTLNAKP